MQQSYSSPFPTYPIYPTMTYIETPEHASKRYCWTRVYFKSIYADDELLESSSKRRRRRGYRNRYDDRKKKRKKPYCPPLVFTVEGPQTLPSLEMPIEAFFLLLLNAATQTWNTHRAKTRTQKNGQKRGSISTYMFSIFIKIANSSNQM